MEHFDDIFRNFTNETYKYKGRFGNIRDEEKILAVKMMPNYRFRGATFSYEEFLI